MIDIRQSKEWRPFCVSKGWQVVEMGSADKKHKVQAIIIPIGMFGLSFLKLQRAEYDPDWEELKKIRRKYWVVSSVIEPAKIESPENYKKAGYKITNFPYLATKTVVVDLGLSKAALWKNMSENSRRLITKNKGTGIRRVSPATFLSYWKKNSKIWTLKIEELENLKSILKNKVSFLLSFKGGVCHSGLLLIETEDSANYFHSFTTEDGRKSGAHFYLVWQMILKMKRLGKRFFDFEGIYDKRWPQKKWLGFTEFKKKFGGEEITFEGCFHRWF